MKQPDPDAIGRCTSSHSPNADARAHKQAGDSPRPARTTDADARAGRPSPLIILLFAAASGLSVANAYFAHPMLDLMADDLGLPRARAGWIVAATQIGYGFGLVLLVPLGDLFDRRRLLIVQSLLSAITLLAICVVTSAAAGLAAMAAIGLLAVVTQSFVAYAASLTDTRERGHVVGIVTSGIVVGILLARTIAGGLADLLGWRSVYLASSLITLVIVLLLINVLPRQPRASATPTFRLVMVEPALRIRGIIAMLIFANVTTLLTPLVLPLSSSPFSLSHSQVGLFGLAGVAGALAASRAGRWTDRGLGQRTTGIALVLMLVAWLPIALLPQSLLWLVLGVIVIDFGLQAVHVTNQAMIYRVRPEAQSRLTAAYMLFYSIGSALGSAASTFAYARSGWPGVCMLGTGMSVTTLCFLGTDLALDARASNAIAAWRLLTTNIVVR